MASMVHSRKPIIMPVSTPIPWMVAARKAVLLYPVEDNIWYMGLMLLVVVLCMYTAGPCVCPHSPHRMMSKNRS